MKRGQKAPGDQVINFGLIRRQFFRRLVGGDDGKVVGDLGVVENTLRGRVDPAVFNHARGVDFEFAAEAFQDAQHRRAVVLGQRPGIGARVGDRFVPLVQRLGDAERFAGGQAEVVVPFALEGRQVVEAWRDLGGALFLLGDERLGVGRRGRAHPLGQRLFP